MPKNFVSLMLLSFSLLLSACGSSQSFTQEEKKFVHNLFLTQYLWYDQVASNINYQSFTTPNALIDALRVNPPDRWSFSLTSEEYDNFVNQKTEGFGFGFTPEFNIFLVRIGSPAYGKLFRGDKIISINGNLASTQALKSAKKN